MSLPLQGVGGVAAPAPAGPVGRIMQRVLALRDISPSPDVLRAVETISNLTRAEDAVRQGVAGELLDRVILYLANTGNRATEVNDVVVRVLGLQPAVNDSGYC